MHQLIYFKWYQSEDRWLYVKFYANRQPPAQEAINFFTNRPVIDFQEINLSETAGQIMYSALFESTTPIECKEYEAAYQQATSEVFDVYINGQKQIFDFL
jgi:hypothetical protein